MWSRRKPVTRLREDRSCHPQVTDSRPSSNRTGGFPASGFPKVIHRIASTREPILRSRLGFAIKRSLQFSNLV